MDMGQVHEKLLEFFKDATNGYSLADDARCFHFFIMVKRPLPEDIDAFMELKFIKAARYDFDGENRLNCFIVHTASNKKASLMSIKYLKKQFGAHRIKWDDCFVAGLRHDSGSSADFLSKFAKFHKTILADGEVTLESNFDFFSAQEFCVQWNVTSKEQLLSIYTSLRKGSPVKTKIPKGALKGQEQNAIACFDSTNPMVQIKAVVEAALSRLTGEFRDRPRLGYLFAFLAEHDQCCFPTLVDETKKQYRLSAYFDWLTYMEIDPYYFCLCLCSGLNDKPKKGRNILISSRESDIGKSYFLNSLSMALKTFSPPPPIGSFLSSAGRFSFQFAKSQNALIAIADDVQKQGLAELHAKQGLLDGESVGPIDTKYGRVEESCLAPFLMATNVSVNEIKADFKTLTARMEMFEMFGEKLCLGEINEFRSLLDFFRDPNSSDERMCQLATWFFRLYCYVFL